MFLMKDIGKSISIINIPKIFQCRVLSTLADIEIQYVDIINIPKIFQCRVLSTLADIEIQYVDIIKGNILIEIILQAVLELKPSGIYINFVDQGFSFLF